MRKTYGDLTTCQQRVGVDCAARADGARWYAAQVSLPVPALGPRQKSCAQSIAQASCNDFEDQIASNDCDPVPGKTPDGYLCASGKECQSAHCGKENPDAEAKCVRVAAIGASCGNGIAMCDTGASCTLGKCVKFGGEGASCIDAVPPCAGFLTCFGGKCAKAAAIGERCGDGLPSCVDEANDSITCAAGVCTVAAFAKAGEACDLAAGPFCEGGGFCQGDLVGPNGAVEFVGTHRCLAPSQDGNACDGNRMKGPGCLAPSSCDLETNSCQPPVYTAMMTRTQITRVKP